VDCGAAGGCKLHKHDTGIVRCISSLPASQQALTVMPWMLSRNTFLWRLAPPLPRPLPPLPRPDILVTVVWWSVDTQQNNLCLIGAASAVENEGAFLGRFDSGV
jgi:hypothetical protein